MKAMLVAASAALVLGGCSVKSAEKAEAPETDAAAQPAASDALQRPSDTDSEAYMHQAEQDWAMLAVTHDPGLLNRILADDYVGVSSSGTVRDKKAQIEDENSPASGNYASAKLNYVHYRHFGDTVIAQGSESLQHSNGGADRNLIWTDVWMWRDGKWQVVASQDSVLPPAK